MSRHLRSTTSIMQAASSLAGPSTFRPLSIPRSSVQPMQRRNLNLNSLVPSFLRGTRQERAEEAEKQAAAMTITETPQNAEGEATGSIFQNAGIDSAEKVITSRPTAREHRYSSAKHKISPRKLNMLSRQIAGLPVDEAIMQMQFSEKAASKWIKSTLALARDHAELKGIRRQRMIVEQSWVNKEQFGPKQIDIKGRGRFGIKRHPYSRIHVLLAEGQTKQELAEKKFVKQLGKIRSAGLVREDTPLRRRTTGAWAW